MADTLESDRIAAFARKGAASEHRVVAESEFHFWATARRARLLAATAVQRLGLPDAGRAALFDRLLGIDIARPGGDEPGLVEALVDLGLDPATAAEEVHRSWVMAVAQLANEGF